MTALEFSSTTLPRQDIMHSCVHKVCIGSLCCSIHESSATKIRHLTQYKYVAENKPFVLDCQQDLSNFYCRSQQYLHPVRGLHIGGVPGHLVNKAYLQAKSLFGFGVQSLVH